MESYEQDIMALRKAASARNLEQTQFLLKKIFLNLEFYRALAVVVERAHTFVQTFEQYYPDERWPRQILVQIASLGTAPGQLPPQAMKDFHAPGAANFLKSLSDMAHALQPGPVPPRVGHLVNGVVNAIMAELVEAWYRPRLDDWERVRTNQFDASTGQYTDPEATMIAYQFWTDASTAERDITLWLAAADSIEGKFKRQL